MENKGNRQCVTVECGAEFLGLKPATLRAWMMRRKIGFVRLGRAVRIPVSELERLIDHGLVPARPERDAR